MEGLNLLLSLITGSITWFFNAEVIQGVTLGWILIVVVIMSFIIKQFLRGEKHE